MLAVFKREFKAYFSNPLGFIILAVIFFFIGFGFYQIFGAGAPAVEYTVLFPAEVGILFFVIPVITMRLFSDERRTKTDQVLFTAPVKLISIVLGKFFAAFVLKLPVMWVYFLLCTDEFVKWPWVFKRFYSYK